MMNCERAREFLSDYLETTLDRPMTGAVESHLSACSGCRKELEALRATWQELSRLPAVEPPARGAQDVVWHLQRLREQRAEDERARVPSFLEWLRGVSPVRVAMTTALATLVVAGSLLVPWLSETKLGFVPPSVDPLPRQQAPVSRVPAVYISYGRLTPGGQEVTVRVSPPAELAAPHVRLTGAGRNGDWRIAGALSPVRPLDIPVLLTAGRGGGEVLRLTVTAETGEQYRYLLALPLEGMKHSPVSLAFFDQSLDEGLRRLAVSLDRPAVVNLGEEPLVSLTVDMVPPAQALQSLAAAAGYQVHVADGLYRLTASGQPEQDAPAGP